MDTPTIRESGEKVATSVPPEETPHACWDGWVFLGFSEASEDGEEVIEAVPCRRCLRTSSESL